jgi:uncharacterized protein
LLAYMDDVSMDDNIVRMKEAFGKVKVGEVAEASRDAFLNDVTVKVGHSIAVFDGRIVCSSPAPEKSVADLVHAMTEESDEIITVYYGASVSKEEADSVQSLLRETHPEKDVELYFGGQPYAQYIIAVE